MKSSQLNFDLQLPGSYLVCSYLITTVITPNFNLRTLAASKCARCYTFEIIQKLPKTCMLKINFWKSHLPLSWKFWPHSCITTLGSGLHGGREPKIDGSDTTTGQFSGRLLWGSSASAEFAISSPPLSTDENQIQPDLTIWKCAQISLFKTVYWIGKQRCILKVL